MKLHGNARTCPRSRRLLVARIECGWSVRRAAAAAGVSERTAAKWRARWRAEGDSGLLDRSSRPSRQPRLTPADRVEAVLRLRRLRMTGAEIAEVLGMALSTVSLIMRRAGVGRRSQLEPLEPLNRYEHERPGELVHLDIKKLARFDRAGHRLLGRGRGRFETGAGYEWNPPRPGQSLQLPKTTRQPQPPSARDTTEQHVWEQQLGEEIATSQ